MSPSYRDPAKREEGARSFWGTTSIFLALGFLTALMALLVYSAIQSVGAGGALERTEIRATR